MDVFNRLLAKNIKASGWGKSDHMEITPQQIRSRRERRSTRVLSHFYRPHRLDDPHCEDCPLIFAVYKGEERLLDGHARINYWVKQRNTDDHDVNVHIIKSE